MLAVRLFQHAQGAGHAHGTTTDHGFFEGHQFAMVVDKQFFVAEVRGSFAAIEHLQFLTIMVQHEGAAADAAGLRLYQVQHHLNGNRRINC